MAGKSITLREISDRRAVITNFYNEEDDFWHQHVHENGGVRAENIEDTLFSLSEDSTMWAVDVSGVLAGFFVLDGHPFNVITAFHVKKEFRDGWFFRIFWSLVKSKMDNDSHCGIYVRNEAAINHFKRQGFPMVGSGSHRGQDFWIFEIKK